jgi:predicted kinase
MATVHLICGSTGAGKTTYAIALAARAGAVRLSMDEWMATLFVADRPDPPSLPWALERLERCERQLWALAEQLIERDMDVVLDVGLSTRDQRERFRMLVAQTRASSKLHYLDVNVDTRRARVLQRGSQTRAQSFEISAAMFDAMEPYFEPPTDDELYGAMIVCED